MMTVLGCITAQHDLWLVLVAALVCVAGSWAAIRLFDRLLVTTGLEKAAWLLLTAVIAGASIWCTHFIAMLGFEAGPGVAFDPVLTILSLLVGMAGAAAAFACSSRARWRSAPAIGGAILGLAISAMHYSGMMAYRVSGLVTWDPTFLVWSIAAAVVFAATALHAAVHARVKHRKFLAAGLLVTSIVCLHFIGMTAFQVQALELPDAVSNPDALRALAIAVAGVALVIVAAGLASNLIDYRAREEASETLSNMSNGLLMVTQAGRIQLFNSRVLELFGLTPQQLQVGMTLDDYIRNVAGNVGWSPERAEHVIANHALWMTKKAATRVEHHFDDGTVLNIVCRPMHGGGAILTYDDVTEARAGQQKVAHMAFHDELTGLPNRRSFLENLGEMASAAPFLVLMIDLDRFKAVNDTLGHASGDQLLVQVARRLRGACGASDLLFRLGGDEFAILTSIACDVAQLTADLIAAASLPFQVNEHAISIGCSIGVARTDRGSDPALVQQKADLALYKAKEAGRGRAELYRDGMMEEAAQRHRIEREIAVAAEAGQLELYYQPLYDLPSRQLSGFEALVRWHHPTRGMVSPAEFIPIAEQTGAIIGIGAWVIEQACRQIAAWPSHLYVSINVSPMQLCEGFPAQLADALARYHVSPKQIEVELTETAMVDNSKQIAATLGQLRALGVRIAMDDFGTGYSSLAHLREFQLDRIKIDRSFINTSQSDHGAAAVVRAVTRLAQELAISTTGEGVESEDQLANLVALGCDTAQGYLLGRPLTAEAATDLLAMPHLEQSAA